MSTTGEVFSVGHNRGASSTPRMMLLHNNELMVLMCVVGDLVPVIGCMFYNQCETLSWWDPRGKASYF